MKRRERRWMLLPASLTLALLHLPLLILVLFSFNQSRFSSAWTGFTLDWYRRLVDRPDILHALVASLGVGASATFIATVLGTLLAIGVARGSRGRRAAEGALYLPVVTPEIVVGISLLLLFAVLGVPLGFGTIIVAHATFGVPFVAVVVLARLAGMDRSLEEAAMILGARPWTVFWRITVPALMPAIAAGALLAFTLSFDDFVITFFVSGVGSTTLPLLTYGMVRRGVEPTINAISTIMIVITTAAVLVADQAMRRARGRKAVDATS